jgi:DNA-binding MarR family transcriptional regulator
MNQKSTARRTAGYAKDRRASALSRIPTIVEDAQVSTLINLAARLTNKAARIRLGSIGAWPGQIPLLLWLLEEDGVLQKDLVERANIEQSTVAEHLDRMERDDLIYRSRDPEDGRKYRIYLTEKTRRMSTDLLNELETGARVFIKGIRARDLAVFDTVIRKIIANLDEFTR